MYAFNYHDNSDDYKNLGTLHKDNRTVDYFPQDGHHEFSTKPQVLGHEYDIVGRREAAGSNIKAPSSVMISERDQPPLSRRTVSSFPLTTNQDFHNNEVFDKARYLGMRIDKQNFKKHNPFAAYVNAMFNQGVFVNPWQD